MTSQTTQATQTTPTRSPSEVSVASSAGSKLRTSSAASLIVLGIILIVAAALRFYKLDAQSLWYDEGNSARIAERSLQLIIEGAAGDIHPPLYYIVLEYWRVVFGEGEAALRSFSALCGVLTVLFAYLIGRDLFNRRVGLIAAFLLAVAPFAVYYSQEARMYSLLALCAAASTWALLRILNSQFSILNSILYVLATAAGLYTQYAYPFVMIAQGVCVLMWTTDDRRQTVNDGRPSSIVRHPLVYALASLVAIALYLPWMPIAVRQVLGWGVERQSYGLGAALLDAYRTLVVGRTLPLEQAAVPMALFALFVILGVLLGGRDSLTSRLAMLVLGVLPLTLLFIFNLYRDAYLKFLLVCILPLCVLAAQGIAVIGDWLSSTVMRESSVISRTLNFKRQVPNVLSHDPRFASRNAERDRGRLASCVILAGLVGVTLIPSLNNLYNNPAYARDDYRDIQRMISTSAGENAAVIFIAPNQWEVYTYYQRDDKNLYPGKYRPGTYAEVARQLEQIASSHDKLFVLYFAERDADPEGWYELWLSGGAHKVHEEWIGNIRLAVYAPIPSESEAWTMQSNTPATFGEDIKLAGVKATLGDMKRGDIVLDELSWQTQTMLSARYKAFIHVGPDDGPPIAQNDSEPVAGYRPTNSWKPGEIIVDRQGVWIKPGTPVGRYGVFVGLYDAETGQRLPITRNGKRIGDRLKIGEITIQ